MSIKPYWLIIIVQAIFISNAHAQNILPDSSSQGGAVNKAIDYYNETIAEQSEIYNGTAYELAPKANKGSVYFQDRNYLTPASIRYNGYWYREIPVLYDVYNDIMVAASRNFFNYILRAEKLSDVNLLSHHFVYLNTENAGNLKPGYYDELYAGKIVVLVKRTKTVNNNVTAQAVEVNYTDANDIYIKKGDKYYYVNSKGSAMDVLKDRKKELEQYLKSNKIKYNKNKETSVAGLARYYDQITN